MYKLIAPNLLINPDAATSNTVSPVGFALPIERISYYRKLWLALHSNRAITEEWLVDWMAKIPLCDCRVKLEKILESNPLRSHDSDKWAWEIHNEVNATLRSAGHDRPHFTWEQFAEKHRRWKLVSGARVGFLSVNYEAVGGTETFHQTLCPRLGNTVGFVSWNPLNGDTARLRVPAGQGLEDAASLCLQSDIVVSWNIDWSHLPRPPKVIAVHHGSLEDEWGTRLTLQGDLLVAVNADVAAKLRSLTEKPVFHISNAVDPERLKPISLVDTFGKKICLWSHRFSPEKRPELAIQIAEQLPPDWHMVMTGHRGQQITPSDRVTVLPPQHPGDWLSVASCFLSTAKFEGFGLSVAEAITAGVPVVSTLTGIASRPGLAMTLPIDAEPSEWASAIARSGNQTLPSRDLFSLDSHLEAWSDVIRLASES